TGGPGAAGDTGRPIPRVRKPLLRTPRRASRRLEDPAHPGEAPRVPPRTRAISGRGPPLARDALRGERRLSTDGRSGVSLICTLSAQSAPGRSDSRRRPALVDSRIPAHGEPPASLRAAREVAG